MTDAPAEYHVILSTGAVLAAHAIRDTDGGGLRVWLTGTPMSVAIRSDEWLGGWQSVPSDFTLGPSAWVAYRRVRP